MITLYHDFPGNQLILNVKGREMLNLDHVMECLQNGGLI